LQERLQKLAKTNLTSDLSDRSLRNQVIAQEDCTILLLLVT